jgi:hypothetical protein
MVYEVPSSSALDIWIFSLYDPVVDLIFIIFESVSMVLFNALFCMDF